MKRRNVFLFFVLPFMGVFLFFTLASFLSGQADLKIRTEALVRVQLAATAGILRVTVANFLDEGVPPDRILDSVLSEEDIYFIALLDERKTVLAWNSRFEGYLPISLREARGSPPRLPSSHGHSRQDRRQGLGEGRDRGPCRRLCRGELPGAASRGPSLPCPEPHPLRGPTAK